MQKEPIKRTLSLRDLYPHLNEEQLKEAEENLEEYLALVFRIYERIRKDPHTYSAFKALTDSTSTPYNEVERSKTNNDFNSSKKT